MNNPSAPKIVQASWYLCFLREVQLCEINPLFRLLTGPEILKSKLLECVRGVWCSQTRQLPFFSSDPFLCGFDYQGYFFNDPLQKAIYVHDLWSTTVKKKVLCVWSTISLATTEPSLDNAVQHIYNLANMGCMRLWERCSGHRGLPTASCAYVQTGGGTRQTTRWLLVSLETNKNEHLSF